MSERKTRRIVFGVAILIALYITIYKTLITTHKTITITIPPPFTINPPNYTYVYPIATLPIDDYSTLIDITNFKFNIENDICGNSTGPTLLILIHSAPGNFVKRRIIRSTWGRSKDGIRIAFVIGEVSDITLNKQLTEENELHKDFIQGNFVDSYRNMTYKHVTVLKYAVYHCPEAKYVLKADDDIFVNINALYDFINDYLGSVSELLLCKIIRNARVFRSFRSKWHVSLPEYPARTYPTYCLGFAILYSPDVLFEVYKNAQKLPYFWIDDVHVTGTAVVGTNFTHADVSRWVMQLSDLNESNVKTILFGNPGMTRDEVLDMWNYTQRVQHNSEHVLHWLP